MKVFVTGVTGKSGSAFLRRFSNENPSNVQLVCLTRDEAKIDNSLRNNNIEYVCGNIKDTEFLKKAMSGCDSVLHISSIFLSKNIIDAVLSNNIERVILVHTTGIYSKFKEAGQEYLEIEKSIEQKISVNKKMKVTILRPTMIYGTIQDNNMIKFIGMVDKLRIFPIVKSGKYALQPVNYKDLGNAYYEVLLNPEKLSKNEYILSGNDVINLIDMLKMISAKLGKKTLFIPVPFFLAYGGAWFVYLLSFGHADYREKVQRLVEPRAYSNEDARADFNYSPMRFDVGLQEEIDEYLKLRKE